MTSHERPTTPPTDDELRRRARALGLLGLLAHWGEPPDPEAPIAQWLAWEEAERQRHSLERRLRAAHLGRFKLITDFDWTWPQRCDREIIEDLLSLAFLAEMANAVIVGPNGVGKSTLARNIAYQAVLHGHTVRFITASELLNDLAAQEGAAALRRRLARYTQPRLLVIDELGYLSYDNRHADLLFEVLSRRYDEKSTLVTTNKPFSEWNQVFPNATCVVTLVDRLVHRADIVVIEGASYRLKDAKERNERLAKERAARRRDKKPADPDHKPGGTAP